MRKGFTLLEILLVVGAIAVLASVVIVAINPGKQLAAARNTTRQIDVHTIADALYQFTLDHDGAVPIGLTSTSLQMLGTDASGCSLACGAINTGGSGGTPAGTFTATDNQSIQFSAGNFSGTAYDTPNAAVQLNPGTLSGNFTSAVKDAGIPDTVWNTIAWAPNWPSYKELPNNAGTETGYANGNANMAGNVGLWHLNETGSATSFIDNSGNNNQGTCQGNSCPALGVVGKLNTAANFDGNSVITIPNSTSINVKGDISLEAWIKPSALGGVQNIISQWQNIVTQDHYILALSDKAVVMAVADGKIGESGLTSNTQLNNNTWYHIVGIWKTNRQYNVYINGVLDSTGTQTGNGSNQISTLPVNIGRQTSNGSLKRAFVGAIDEVSVYSRELTPSEILAHYRRGATRLKLQVRSCSDSACAGQNFVGPGGDASTFFTELSNNTLNPPSLTLTNVTNGRYIQYKASLDRDNATINSGLQSITLAGTTPAVVGSGSASTTAQTTANACLDLGTSLTDYIASMPFDPKFGSTAKSYYATKLLAKGRILVASCGAEQGAVVSVTR